MKELKGKALIAVQNAIIMWEGMAQTGKNGVDGLKMEGLSRGRRTNASCVSTPQTKGKAVANALTT